MIKVKRAPLRAWLMDEVAAVRAGVAAGDREAEPAADVRRIGARETLEQAEAHLLGNALTAVLDRDPELRVARLR